MKRGSIARKGKVGSEQPSSGLRSSALSRNAKASPRSLGRKGALSRRPIRAQATRDGDSAKAVKAELDHLVREILPLVETCCFVCAAPGKHIELHPGHYITRKVLALRWDWTRNVHLQCNPCNGEHNTNRGWYRGMLVLELGEDAVIGMDRIEQENPRLEYTDLLAIRDRLRDDLKTLKANI